MNVNEPVGVDGSFADSHRRYGAQRGGNHRTGAGRIWEISWGSLRPEPRLRFPTYWNPERKRKKRPQNGRFSRFRLIHGGAIPEF